MFHHSNLPAFTGPEIIFPLEPAIWNPILFPLGSDLTFKRSVVLIESPIERDGTAGSLSTGGFSISVEEQANEAEVEIAGRDQGEFTEEL
jgi:hypothetical protein